MSQSSIRVCFVYSSIDTGIKSQYPGQAERAGECSQYCERAFKRGAISVHRRAITNLLKLVPEVLIFDIVRMTMSLSDPVRLAQVEGKTIVIFDPLPDQVQSFLSVRKPPEGNPTRVSFSKACYDESFELQVSELSLPEETADE